ncbi:MAG: transcriptional regulator [Saprospiraceae bacterium]|nr:transcriptional regulator [Saprospiraceae bacterium]
MKKNIDITYINKDFESRVRLGIMSALMVKDWVTFVDMKEILQLSDGNLASHAAALENKKYIEVKKAFIGKKPETSYRATPEGRSAFQKHIEALEKLIHRL